MSLWLWVVIALFHQCFATSLPLSNPGPSGHFMRSNPGGGHEFWPNAQGDGNAWNWLRHYDSNSVWCWCLLSKEKLIPNMNSIWLKTIELLMYCCGCHSKLIIIALMYVSEAYHTKESWYHIWTQYDTKQMIWLTYHCGCHGNFVTIAITPIAPRKDQTKYEINTIWDKWVIDVLYCHCHANPVTTAMR